MKHVQGKQPPLWPAGTVGVGLWILQGDPVGRAWDDLITLGKHCVCACVCVCMYRRVFLPWLGLTVCVEPRHQRDCLKHTLFPFVMYRLIFQAVPWNTWMKGTGEGDEWRKETNGWSVCVFWCLWQVGSVYLQGVVMFFRDGGPRFDQSWFWSGYNVVSCAPVCLFSSWPPLCKGIVEASHYNTDR